jgi:hypothetical protein
MTLPAGVAEAILDTVLERLAFLFLTGSQGDPAVARSAAGQVLAAYNVGTEEELRLAAEVISFGFHALSALSQAADPDLSLSRTLRLRGSAVSLSRESHKAQRKLDQLQRVRYAGAALQPAQAQPEAPSAEQTAAAPVPVSEATPEPPDVDRAAGFAAATRPATPVGGRDGGKTWTRAYQQRQAASRITENLRQQQLQHARQSAQAARIPADVVSHTSAP